jgi:hypothetical protein
MKRCPTCDKTFEDSMKFCQTDGTPLLSADETSEDMMKTMVSSPSDISSSPFDSFKTMVGDSTSAGDAGQPETGIDDSVKTQILSREEMDNEFGSGEMKGEMAKDVSPPSPFGDSTPSWMDSPDKSSNDFSSTSSPFDEINSPDYRSSSSPFQQPEPMFGKPEDSFNQSPYGSQADTYNSPMQQSEWTPPPAPMSEWQDQSIGQNTPFQPPISGQGDDKTLAIVSLVCGILSLTCCGPVTGIAALITGYMAKNNVEGNPQQYGGRGLALAGMIMGGISLVLTVLYFIFVIILGVVN